MTTESAFDEVVRRNNDEFADKGALTTIVFCGHTARMLNIAGAANTYIGDDFVPVGAVFDSATFRARYRTSQYVYKNLMDFNYLSLEGGWAFNSVGNLVATATTGRVTGQDRLGSNHAAEAGQTYRCTAVVGAYTAGDFRFVVGGTGSAVALSGIGTHTEDIVAASATAIQVDALAELTATFTKLRVEKL